MTSSMDSHILAWLNSIQQGHCPYSPLTTSHAPTPPNGNRQLQWAQQYHVQQYQLPQNPPPQPVTLALNATVISVSTDYMRVLIPQNGVLCEAIITLRSQPPVQLVAYAPPFPNPQVQNTPAPLVVARQMAAQLVYVPCANAYIIRH